MAKKYLPIVIMLLLMIPSIWFLLLPGFFESDDGEWMIIRFSAFYQALADGQFPVRFLGRLNNGYGYPVADFLYPGFMYLGIPIHILGLNFTDTIKALLVLSMLWSGLFSYLWLSKLFDKVSSFFGALFLVYAPYHIFDLYKRGSIVELLAITILPFILWQAERKSFACRLAGFFWTTAEISFLILSYNNLAVLFLGVLILYFLLDILISKNKMGMIYKHGSELLLGIGLSSFFWIPAVFDLQYTVFSQTKVSDWAKYFSDFNLIGISTVIIFLTVPILFVTKKIKPNEHRLTILLFIIGLISIFFALPASSAFWRILPVSFIQFPFRMLSISIVSASFLLAFILSNLPFKLKITFGSLIILLTLLNSQAFILGVKVKNTPDSLFSTNEATTTVQDEYMPKWVKRKPTDHFREKVEIVNGRAEIKDIAYDNKKIEFTVFSNENAKVRVNTIYYPGWVAKVNGREKPIDYKNELGVMDVALDKGENKVELSFNETPLRFGADVLTIFSFIILIWVAKRSKFKRF